MSSLENALIHHGPSSGIDVPISTELAEAAAPPETATAIAEDSELQLQIAQAVCVAAGSLGFSRGQIGVLITDDASIHAINLRHLDHDYPTDVISFDYYRGEAVVQGELAVSLCTAKRLAAEGGWNWRSELLLYVVHGTLHICGLEDATAAQQQQMRAAELVVLRALGVGDAEALARGFAPPARAEQEAAEQEAAEQEASEQGALQR